MVFMKGIEVRPFIEDDIEGMLCLFREVFGWQMTKDVWFWKYKRPYTSIIPAIVAISQGTVIGHYGGMPQRILINGRETLGIIVCDVMVHPRFRGFKRGPFFMLMKKFFETFVGKDGPFYLAYGFPNPRHARLGELLGGYETIGVVHRFKKRVKSYKYSPLHFFYKLEVDLSFLDKRINNFWQKYKERIKIGIIRDRAYFLWRYGKCPSNKYILLCLRRRWENSFLAIGVAKRQEKSLILLEFMALPGFRKAFFQSIENFAFILGCSDIWGWVPSSLALHFVRLGCCIEKTDAIISCNIWTKTIDPDNLRKNLFYSLGDSDLA